MANKKITPIEIKEEGVIVDIKKEVITIEGLPSCVYGELVEFSSGDKGIIVEFDQNKVMALLIGAGLGIKTGDKVVSRGQMLVIPVGDGLMGRIVNTFSRPLDGKPAPELNTQASVFKDAPPIMSRVPVHEPLRTGIKIIDTIIPIGRGQRELIIGDRQTGKTTIAVDSIINQADQGVICVYCWIGGSYMAMVKTIETLAANNAMDYTVVLAAPASVSSTEQYLAPYAACAIGEYFMNRKKDVLIVFDNLTKHAWIYRQISLLLNRAPGREAYPGDIFYIHSQLMERAGRLDPNIGGSMTFLPIIDTLQGDVTGYIQTNLVSMTDGQIYTSSALFNEGFRPAIDVGLSVSRIGSKVQTPALKEVSSKLRLEYARFKELQKLTKLRARISSDIAHKIHRGQTLTELFMQEANRPVPEAELLILFYAFESGALDKLSAEDLATFRERIMGFIRESNPDILELLAAQPDFSEEMKVNLEHTFLRFFEVFGMQR